MVMLMAEHTYTVHEVELEFLQSLNVFRIQGPISILEGHPLTYKFYKVYAAYTCLHMRIINYLLPNEFRLQSQ